MTISSSNNYSLTASSNILVTSVGQSINTYAHSNITFAADTSNVYLNLLVPSDNIEGYSLNDTKFSASNDMYLNAHKDTYINTSNLEVTSSNISITASNNMTISASNTLNLAFGTLNMASTGDMEYKAKNKIGFFIKDSAGAASNEAIFQVMPDTVHIRGDLIISGSINTSNIINTTITTVMESLKVTDKIITLANFGSNFFLNEAPYDSANTNGGAGIVIDGIPTSGSNYAPELQVAYEKSFKWNYNQGMENLGTNGGITTEPSWDLKGGAFRLINQKIVTVEGVDSIKQVAFAFRINELDELELTKQFKHKITGETVTKRVARFGRLNDQL